MPRSIGWPAPAPPSTRSPRGSGSLALCTIAADLGSLVSLPEDLEALARRSRIPAAPVRVRKVPAAAAPPPLPAGDREGRAERRARLATPLSAIPGAHPAPRALLEERGRATVEAALEFLPRAWQDRTTVRRVAELRTGEPAIAVVTVRTVRSQRMRNGKPMLKVGTADGQSRLDLVFFNPPPWRQKQFTVGEQVLVSGEIGPRASVGSARWPSRRWRSWGRETRPTSAASSRSTRVRPITSTRRSASS